jgi:hypothetical protein
MPLRRPLRRIVRGWSHTRGHRISRATGAGLGCDEEGGSLLGPRGACRQGGERNSKASLLDTLGSSSLGSDVVEQYGMRRTRTARLASTELPCRSSREGAYSRTANTVIAAGHISEGAGKAITPRKPTTKTPGTFADMVSYDKISELGWKWWRMWLTNAGNWTDGNGWEEHSSPEVDGALRSDMPMIELKGSRRLRLNIIPNVSQL